MAVAIAGVGITSCQAMGRLLLDRPKNFRPITLDFRLQFPSLGGGIILLTFGISLIFILFALDRRALHKDSSSFEIRYFFKKVILWGVGWGAQ